MSDQEEYEESWHGSRPSSIYRSRRHQPGSLRNGIQEVNNVAVEEKRSCGYRKVGGIYIIGEGIPVVCDRLPMEIKTCPVCGEGIRFTRVPREINPRHLFGGFHEPPCVCRQRNPTCRVCNPPDFGYIWGVGHKFYATPEEFIAESNRLGISKRVPRVPKRLKIGETSIYLIHNRACLVGTDDDGAPMFAPGVFLVFIPTRIEKLIWKKDADVQTMKSLVKRGIFPVVVPDDDKDHAPSSHAEEQEPESEWEVS